MTTTTPNSSLPSTFLISLGEKDLFNKVFTPLLSELKFRSNVTQCADSNGAIAILSSLNPSAVLITDPEIVERKHKVLLGKLVDYAKSGGTVIFCGLFSGFITVPDLARFFSTSWSLPWKSGSYARNSFVLNSSRSARLKNNREILPSYHMKALHITGATRDSAVYIPETGYRSTESPILFTPFGQGFLGYIGDVNAEIGSIRIILAMCNLERNDLSVWSKCLLQIALIGVSDPHINRTLSIPPLTTFHTLHCAIQVAFNWRNVHLYRFEVLDAENTPASSDSDRPGILSPPASILLTLEPDSPQNHDDEASKDSKLCTLRDVFDNEKYKTKQIRYLYDFGDNWEHSITFIGRANTSTSSIVCLSGEGGHAAED